MLEELNLKSASKTSSNLKNDFIKIGASCGLGAKDADTRFAPYEFMTSQDVMSCSFGPLKISQIWQDSALKEEMIAFYRDLADRVYHTLSYEKKKPLIIGGDHSVAIGTWAGVSNYAKEQNRALSLLWIDAHLDAHTVETSPSDSLHGMPVATLIGEGVSELISLCRMPPAINPEHLAILGFRSFEKEEEERLDRLGVYRQTSQKVIAKGFKESAYQALKQIKAEQNLFGISLDIDAFDPQYAPATGTPEPHGLNPDEVIEFLKEVVNHENFIAFEFVEYNPKLDKDRQTYRLAEKIISVFS